VHCGKRAMAVCIPVPPDGHHQDANGQLGYGTPCAYTGAALDGANDGPSNLGSPHAAWPSADVLQPPYWQDPSEQGDYAALGGGAMPQEWPGLVPGSWATPGAMPGGDGEWNCQQGGRVPGNAGRAKRRFCTSFPDVQNCRRGLSCAFAHTREEISASLLDISEENQEPSALTDSFFMYKYKTRWCPIGVQHEWHTCVYAHNYQDARRPISIGYGARLCPYWSKKDTGAGYSQRCPLGLRCPYSHGAKEQLYHPHYFKSVVCRDLRGKTACPRQKLCAFFHHRHERRSTPPDDVDYSSPLKNEALPTDWIAEFLSPPFLPESGRAAVGFEDLSAIKGDNGVGVAEGASAVVPYPAGAHMVQHAQGQYAQQMPCVLLLPMNAVMPAQGAVPCAAADPNSPNGTVAGMQAMQSNWVFVPLEEGGSPMC